MLGCVSVACVRWMVMMMLMRSLLLLVDGAFEVEFVVLVGLPDVQEEVVVGL